MVRCVRASEMWERVGGSGETEVWRGNEGAVCALWCSTRAAGRAVLAAERARCTTAHATGSLPASCSQPHQWVRGCFCWAVSTSGETQHTLLWHNTKTIPHLVNKTRNQNRKYKYKFKVKFMISRRRKITTVAALVLVSRPEAERNNSKNIECILKQWDHS